jgi:hypothetical protein
MTQQNTKTNTKNQNTSKRGRPSKKSTDTLNESTSESTNNELVAFYHGRNLRANSLSKPLYNEQSAKGNKATKTTPKKDTISNSTKNQA